MRMTTCNVSLAAFVLVVVVNALVLLLDWRLYASGHDTVSEWVWRMPWAGAPLLAWQALGFWALLLHFYWRRWG